MTVPLMKNFSILLTPYNKSVVCLNCPVVPRYLVGRNQLTRTACHLNSRPLLFISFPSLLKTFTMLRGNLLKLSRSINASAVARSASTRSISSVSIVQKNVSSLCRSTSRLTGVARFSTPTDGDKPPTGDKREVAKFDMDEFDDYEEPTTAGAKVLQSAESDLSCIEHNISILTP